MSYGDERQNQIDSELQRLSNLKRQLRQQEKNIDVRSKMLTEPSQFQYNSTKALRNTLSGALAPHMMPVNVGALNEVAWPFWFQAEVDFGTSPILAQNIMKKTFFQIDQEASFLLMSITTNFGKDVNNLSALERAPVQVEFIDRQSSRRFNNAPIPLQMLGNNSNPTILPTPMLIMPNAFFDIQVSGLWPNPKQYIGSGLLEFSFFGYRTRVENADKVLSTIFG